MATGDLIKLGTLYMNGTKVNRPSDAGHYYNGGSLEIRNTQLDEQEKLYWREVNDNGKKFYVADRALANSISWNDLSNMSLVHGRNITIDGKAYRIRLMTGGSKARNGNNGGMPENNEWDRWLVNEANLDGLRFTNWNIPSIHLYTWAQENVHTNSYTLRGGPRVEYFTYADRSSKASNLVWRPVMEVLNEPPDLSLNTTNNQTLYENDVYSVSGTVKDTDSGNTVIVKYSINNGTARTLHTFVSDGSSVSFNKSLTFKRDRLHDGSTEVTGDLQEGVTHTLRVWAEDDQGGKSTVHSRTFNVIPNRPEVKVNGQSRVVETISCKVNGQTREVVKMWVKVNGELREV